MEIKTKLFSYEYAVTRPGCFDEQIHRLSQLKSIKAPILRLYCRGLSDEDQYSSVLLHIHNLYPYFFVQLPDNFLPSIKDMGSFIRQFASDLEVLFLSQYPTLNNQVNGVIHDILLVKGIPFTGYQSSETLFLKIFVTENNLLNLVANVLRSGKLITKYLCYETHITLLMKFVNDCQICLQNGIQITNCIQRLVSQDAKTNGNIGLQKISMCDVEFDCQITDILKDQEFYEEITTNIYARQKLSQIKTQQSPILVGDLQTLQKHRREMIKEWNRVISQSAENNETEVLTLNEYDNVRENVQLDNKQVEQKDTENDIMEENMDLDVKAFDEKFDGGTDDVNENGEEQNENELIEFAVKNDQSQIQQDFHTLYYSDQADIPDKSFVWAGKTYDFSQKQNTSLEYKINSNITEQMQNDVISINSEIESVEIEVEMKQKLLNQFKINNEQLVQLKQQFAQRNFKMQQSNNNLASPNVSQMQSQIDEYNRIQQLIQQINENQNTKPNFYLSCIHIEVSKLQDGVIIQFYDSDQQLLITSESSNISTNSKYYIYLFNDVYNINSTIDNVYNEIDKQLQNFNIDKNNVKIIMQSKQEVITEALPLLIQELDPDIIFSWKINLNGIGLITAMALDYEFDLIGSISRTPAKASDQIIKLNKLYKTFEEIKQFFIKEGLYQIGTQINGRLIFGVQGISKQIKLSNYKLQDVLHAIKFNEQYVCNINEYLLNIILNKQHQFINQIKYLIDGYFHIITKNNDICNCGDEVKLSLHTCLIESLQECIYSSVIVQKLNFLVTAVETSYLFKVPLNEGITRGSQYKVEAFLFKESRKQNYILGPSPTHYEVAKMRAMESVPLVAEPLSGYYEYPLLVFDFASLYPSIICAYNLCYCTILENFQKQQQIGPFSINFRLPDFKDINGDTDVIFSPVKCLFVKQRVREGIIPCFLRKSLQTRKQLVKTENELTVCKEQIQAYINNQFQYKIQNSYKQQLNETLQLVQYNISRYHARQMALKGLMNTTYGYTSASFSGRMPCSSLADTIMEMSRQTLEYCIKLVEDEFNLDVLYADTDSMFVYTKKYFNQKINQKEILLQAAELGNRILKTINKQMSPPIRIKLERIYMPCFLVTKKRYVGQSFNPDTIEKMKRQDIKQITRFIDAKGIESIRREVPQLTRSVCTDALQILFQNNDLTQLKQYFSQYFLNYTLRKSNIQDFIFQKKCKFNFSSMDRSFTNMVISKKIGVNAYSLIPEHGERVQYLIIKQDTQNLINSSQQPCDLFQIDSSGSQIYKLHYSYYLERQILNPMQRIFGLCGFSVFDCLKEVSLFILRNQQFLFNNNVDDFEKFKLLIQYYSKLNYQNINYNLNYNLNLVSMLQQCVSNTCKSQSTSHFKYDNKLGINYIIQQSSHNNKQQSQTQVSKQVSQCIMCDTKSNLQIVINFYICAGCAMHMQTYIKDKYDANLKAQLVQKLQLKIQLLENKQNEIIQCYVYKIDKCRNCLMLSYDQKNLCQNVNCPIFEKLFAQRQQYQILSNNIQCLKLLIEELNDNHVEII